MPLQLLEIGCHVEIHAIEWHDFQHETQFHGVIVAESNFLKSIWPGLNLRTGPQAIKYIILFFSLHKSLNGQQPPTTTKDLLALECCDFCWLLYVQLACI